MKAVNIKWDITDGTEDMTQEEIDDALASLPTEIEIPDDIEPDDFDAIDDYLSNKTGFCHSGYELEN